MNHQRQQWLHDFRSSKHRRLSRIIINRSHLHDIRTNDLESLQPINDRQHLAGWPSARFRRTSCFWKSQVSTRLRGKDAGFEFGLPGAKAGSRESMSRLIYTLLLPTRFFSASMTPCAPMRSISRAVMMEKPQRWSLERSSFSRMTGARTAAWIEELRISPCGIVSRFHDVAVRVLLPLREQCEGKFHGSHHWRLVSVWVISELENTYA